MRVKEYFLYKKEAQILIKWKYTFLGKNKFMILLRRSWINDTYSKND
jgi:hypothetical protein